LRVNDPVRRKKARVNGWFATERALSRYGTAQYRAEHWEIAKMKGSGFRPLSSSKKNRQLPGFEQLAIPLFASLYNFAHWLSQNQTDAEDLVQETYLKAWRNYESFEPGTNFRAWIFRILKNSFLGSRSKLECRMTLTLDSEEDLPATLATPESLLLGRFEIDTVQRAIEQLPLNFREVLLLCDVEEASYREIAEILSIPIGTVMSRLARARKIVRESLRNIPDGANCV
jgi:RNA polymerase sigma-70 factor, ECF subfamily